MRYSDSEPDWPWVRGRKEWITKAQNAKEGIATDMTEIWKINGFMNKYMLINLKTSVIDKFLEKVKLPKLSRIQICYASKHWRSRKSCQIPLIKIIFLKKVVQMVSTFK